MIEIVNGNIFDGNDDIICHQVNTFGVMGAGIAAEIKKRFPRVYEIYYEICNEYKSNQLIGNVLFCNQYAPPEIANFFSQNGMGGMSTNYNAMESCLKAVYNYAKRNNRSVAIPYGIGCGIAKGNWDIVYKMIEEVFGNDDVKCTIYKLEQ